MFDLLPEGEYRARAVNAVLGTTKAGNNKVTVDFEIEQEPYVGRHILWDGNFDASDPEKTEWVREKTFDWLLICGWEGDIEDLSTVRKEVLITVEHHMFNGKLYVRVKKIRSISGVRALTGMSETDARNVGAQMKAHIASWAQKKGISLQKTPKAPPRQREPGDDDDDSEIGF